MLQACKSAYSELWSCTNTSGQAELARCSYSAWYSDSSHKTTPKEHSRKPGFAKTLATRPIQGHENKPDPRTILLSEIWDEFFPQRSNFHCRCSVKKDTELRAFRWWFFGSQKKEGELRKGFSSACLFGEMLNPSFPLKLNHLKNVIVPLLKGRCLLKNTYDNDPDLL